VTARFGVILLDVESDSATFVLLVLLFVCIGLLKLVMFELDKVLTVEGCVELLVLGCIVWGGETLVVLDCDVVMGATVPDCDELLVSD
jgi:uncharacterized membrane protein